MCEFPNGIEVSAGELFGIAVGGPTQADDIITWRPELHESSHAGSENYPHESITWEARLGSDISADISMAGEVWRDSEGGAHQWEIDYTTVTSGLVTVQEDSVTQYHGPSHLNLHDVFDVAANSSNSGGGPPLYHGSPPGRA